jgi:GGDEF domain-containing protein
VALASHYSSSEEVLARLNHALQVFRQRTGRPLALSAGAAESSLQTDQGLEHLQSQADAAMYANKCARRNLEVIG